MSTPVRVAIAGLGNRGREAYAKCQFMFPELMKITAVADILPERVKEAAETFGIQKDMCFSSAEEMCAKKDLADTVFLCTPDQKHTESAILALKSGYHLLLEKPMAPTPEECERITRAAEESGKKTAVCHVLRYTPFFQALKGVLKNGEIGELVTVQAIENVGYYHQAHSFVRGNWRNSDLSSPMILQKCCHDMDMILWLSGKRLKSVSAFGDLYLFKQSKAPAGAAKRCLDGCGAKDDCPYDAEKIYITDKSTGTAGGNKGWPLNVLAANPTEESIREAIKTGPYGRCVYHCDNNVTDHMVVNLLLEDELTVNFTMTAFTNDTSRYLKFMGTLGDIVADMRKNTIVVTPFGKTPRTIDIAAQAKDLAGHAGGDHRMVREFLTLIKEGGGSALTAVQNSSESHLACFAAEHSRLNGGMVVAAADFRKRFKKQ